MAKTVNERLVASSLTLMCAVTFLQPALAVAPTPQCLPSESAKLTPVSPTPGGHFGTAISYSGDQAIIGSREDTINGIKSGSASIFLRTAGNPATWTLAKTLAPSDGINWGEFGIAVAIHGDLAVVGAARDDDLGQYSGAAYLYGRNVGGPSNWGLIKKLRASDGVAGDFFGESVAAHDDVVVVGAPGFITAIPGSAYVFQRDAGGPGNWGELKKLQGDDSVAKDAFGASAAMDGDLLILGAYGHKHPPTAPHGAAYIFDRHLGGPDAWGQVKELRPSDIGYYWFFGYNYCVGISGSVALVGAPGGVAGDLKNGAVYVFEVDEGGAGVWGQVAKLEIPDGAVDDSFGWGVAVDGDLAVVGARGRDEFGTNAGAAYLFHRDDAATIDKWRLVGQFVPDDLEAGDLFGSSVAIEKGVVLCGALLGDEPSSDSGVVYSFESASASGVSTYCTPKVTSTGCVPILTAQGNPSATQGEGFVVRAARVPPNMLGLLFYGHSGPAQLPLFGGFLCVQSPIHRTAAQLSQGVGSCDGVFAFDFNQYISTGLDPLMQPGAAVNAQYWFRDPGDISFSVGLTGGIAFELCQ